MLAWTLPNHRSPGPPKEVLGTLRRLLGLLVALTLGGALLAASFATMMAALDDSVQTQRRLVADASHELRTPLTSLTTNLELLREGRGLADPQAPALVGDAREQARELTVLVNDLVDLARYGRTETHTEDIRLDLLADRVAERATARAPEKVFRTELRPCLVHADPDAVERAIGNLVDNAIKWSPAGGRILIRVEESGRVSVSDEGPGIPEGDLSYVFDRFYRSPTARSIRAPGSAWRSSGRSPRRTAGRSRPSRWSAGCACTCRSQRSSDGPV